MSQGFRAGAMVDHSTSFEDAEDAEKITVTITGPAPDWSIPAGSRVDETVAASPELAQNHDGLVGSFVAAVPCSKLPPPFCSCAGGAGHTRNCSCASCGQCGCSTCQICDNKPGPPPPGPPPPGPLPHKALPLPVFTYGAQLSANAPSAAAQEATLLPGSVNAKRRDASVEVSASLVFVTANTSVVNFTVRSLRTSGDGASALPLSLFISGSSVKNASTSTRGDGVDFELPGGGLPGGTCFHSPDFASGGIRILTGDSPHDHNHRMATGSSGGGGVIDWNVTSTAEQGTFIALASVSLPAGGAISSFITITMGRPESCDADAQRVAAIGVTTALAATQARWQQYLDAVLPHPALDATHEDKSLGQNIRWSAVKALMTLINNWRFIPGHRRAQGIIPSYVKYDTAFWSWDR